jgi:hypothetical protein
MASAIAKVLVDKAQMKVVVVPQGGNTLPSVASKDIECGLNSIYDMAFFVTGAAYCRPHGLSRTSPTHS